MIGLHNHFQWFVCAQDIGAEKPERAIFDAAHREATFWVGQSQKELDRSDILHIGDSLAADFCGAKAAGFQAFYLDRTNNPKVNVYQDWLTAPDYDGKTEMDISRGTIKDFYELRELLES